MLGLLCLAFVESGAIIKVNAIKFLRKAEGIIFMTVLLNFSEMLH